MSIDSTGAFSIRARFALTNDSSPMHVLSASGIPVFAEGPRILPVEIKLGVAVDRYAAAGLRQCMKDLGLSRGWLVTSGRERRFLAPDIEIVPWAEIASGQVTLF